MTSPIRTTIRVQTKPHKTSALRGRNDPILQELWAVKAQLNREAGSIQAVIERAQRFDMQATIARLRQEVRA